MYGTSESCVFYWFDISSIPVVHINLYKEIIIAKNKSVLESFCSKQYGNDFSKKLYNNTATCNDFKLKCSHSHPNKIAYDFNDDDMMAKFFSIKICIYREDEM